MTQDPLTSITRRSLVAVLALSATPATLAGIDNAHAAGPRTPRLRKVCMSG